MSKSQPFEEYNSTQMVNGGYCIQNTKMNGNGFCPKTALTELWTFDARKWMASTWARLAPKTLHMHSSMMEKPITSS